MLYKNTASQKIAVYAYTASTGAAKTGDAAQITGYISKDWGAAAAITDTNPTELDATNMQGWYVFDLTQTETNAEVLIIAAVSSTSGVLVDQYQVFTEASLPQTGDAYAVVAHADYGNSKLVRSTTPANTLTVDASHQAFADVSAISGDSTAADRLEAILDAMPGGAVVDDNDPDPTATAFETNLTEATNDHYNGAFVVFTSGALLGQSRKISDYDGTSKVLTVAAAFTAAPTVGDTFLILGRSE
jgi:hypothetical protein